MIPGWQDLKRTERIMVRRFYRTLRSHQTDRLRAKTDTICFMYGLEVGRIMAQTTKG